jgi:hypothetical protein
MIKISLVEDKGDNMKKGLKVFGIGLIGLLIAIALSGCERGCWSKGHAQDSILKKVDHEVKELNLTQAQQVKYEDIRHRLDILFLGNHLRVVAPIRSDRVPPFRRL